ncbi:MAG: LTA synthase family protein [Alphaproteobacteria bacterium]|nr:LTA synthase family protein [Alphaproteobacteria bacterium]
MKKNFKILKDKFENIKSRIFKRLLQNKYKIKIFNLNVFFRCLAIIIFCFGFMKLFYSYAYLEFSVNSKDFQNFEVFFIDDNINRFTSKAVIKVDQSKENEKFLIKIPFHGKIKKIRLDFSPKCDNVLINNLKLLGNSNLDLNIDKSKKNKVDSIMVEDGWIKVFSSQDDPYIVFDVNDDFKESKGIELNGFLLYCIFALVMYLCTYDAKYKMLYFYVLVIGLLFIKYLNFYDRMFLRYGKIGFEELFAVFYYELPILIFLSFLLLLRFQKSVKFLIFIILSIVLIDYIVWYNLSSRFIFSEIFEGDVTFDASWQMLKSYLSTDIGKVSVLIMFIPFYLPNKFKNKRDIRYILLVFFLFIFCLLLPRKTNVHDSEFYNVFQANFKNNQMKKCTKNFVLDLRKNFKLEQDCVIGRGTKKNIIIIIAESLSSYKIKSFNGIEDKMPLLDKISQRGIVYDNYVSNSFFTAGGVFNIITGFPIVSDYSKLGSFSYKGYYINSLPNLLKDSGYKSFYFTGVDLSSNLKNVVENAGFYQVSDSNDVFYNGKKRFLFNGVSDFDLLSNVYQEIMDKKNNPFLFVISTISTHPPFIDPRNKFRSFDSTLNYLENVLNDFILKLDGINFFENGVLIITGDHRVMQPVSVEEYRKYGSIADKKVPLIIIDKDLGHGVIHTSFSHVDLSSSLLFYVTKNACFNKFQKNIFDEAFHKEVCILHSYLTPKDKVGVYCNNTVMGEILLNGDKTKASDSKFESYKDFILYLRTLPFFNEKMTRNDKLGVLNEII